VNTLLVRCQIAEEQVVEMASMQKNPQSDASAQTDMELETALETSAINESILARNHSDLDLHESLLSLNKRLSSDLNWALKQIRKHKTETAASQKVDAVKEASTAEAKPAKKKNRGIKEKRYRYYRFETKTVEITQPPKIIYRDAPYMTNAPLRNISNQRR